MATSTRNRCNNAPNPKNSRIDFSRVGGLTSHLELLREMIILPLLYGQVFHNFNIKAPKGVIFFGPPGTGKTLVAAALATELNKDHGCKKVSFYQRKGADILDKWVGESEKKLRDLFDKAMKSRPSVIFFDELDGLAPERSHRNDQVHTSVVATLLALMDGLDNKPGVIVIGATNRIDAIDTALRRPGRFDRELYFPLPSVIARKEILEVHMLGWRHSLAPAFIQHLADITSGYCGADLQALCADTVVCAFKRCCPDIAQSSFKNKVKVDVANISVQELDFIVANNNLVPTTQRLGNCPLRPLSPFIKPLLQRQLDNVVNHVRVLLPQFSSLNSKFTFGSERYAGRIILKGDRHQGLNTYIVPALLQALEHIPSYVLDLSTLLEKGTQYIQKQRPSILVLPRIDDWWEHMEDGTQVQLTTALEEMHAGLPVLLIVTCRRDVPEMLRNYFQYNSSVVVTLDNPTAEERKLFFKPMFFGNCPCSLYNMLQAEAKPRKALVKQEPMDTDGEFASRVSNNHVHSERKTQRKQKRVHEYRLTPPDLVDSLMRLRGGGNSRHSDEYDSDDTATCSLSSPELQQKRHSSSLQYKPSKYVKRLNNERCPSVQKCCKNVMYYAKESLRMDQKCNRADCRFRSKARPVTLNDLVNCIDIGTNTYPEEEVSNFTSNMYLKDEPINHLVFDQNKLGSDNNVDANVAAIDRLWHRVATQSSNGLGAGHLELLYDTLRACIRINRHGGFHYILQNLEATLHKFENACVTHR